MVARADLEILKIIMQNQDYVVRFFRNCFGLLRDGITGFSDAARSGPTPETSYS
jgi:hypothetical protein